MFKKLFGRAAVAAVGVAAIAQPAIAQETTSAIQGQVRMAGGAPVAGATVTVTHVASGTVSVEKTQGSGNFNIRGLRVGGPYTVEVAGNDLGAQAIDNIYVELATPFKVDFTMDRAAVIDVVAKRPVGAIQTTGSSTLLDRDRLAGVSAVSRDIRSAARIDPLVSTRDRFDGGLSVAGSNPRTNRITIDGAVAQDTFGLNYAGFPTIRGSVSIDAVEQLAVQAVPFDVSNGNFTGGAIDIVLRQGTNDWHGAIFQNYLNDGMVGTRIGSRIVNRAESQDNYGASLFGPLWKDHVFFGGSYEKYVSQKGTNLLSLLGPTINPPLTDADIAAVTNVYQNTYGGTYPVGRILPSSPIFDEKYSVRLDWNITSKHRASASYREAKSSQIVSPTNYGTTSAGLSSQWYVTGENDNVTTFQLNSDWTSALSTELRYVSRDYTRLQEPPGGQGNSDITVCSTPTLTDTSTTTNPDTSCRFGTTAVSVVRFGPDQFRHANYLTNADRSIYLTGTYELGSHLIKGGYQSTKTDIYNIFLPNARGTYYFDNIADFAAGRANRLTYRNALTNNPSDAAANFTFTTNSLFLQDRWDVTNNLTVTGGLRYDWYSVDDPVALNPNFVTRYGYPNTKTFDELDVLMPRMSFKWDATDDFQLSGGMGLFSGGLPKVFLSNSFGNTGFLDNQIQFDRRYSATSPGAGAYLVPGTTNQWLIETTGAVNCSLTPATCTDALNVPVDRTFGTFIPASVRTALGGTSSSPTAPTNSFAPNFEMPSDWRFNASAKYEGPGGWRFGADAVYFQNHTGMAFSDLRARPLIVDGKQALTPDGRIRYDGLSTAQHTARVTSTNPGDNTDVVIFNPDEKSHGFTLALSAGKEWDFGLNFNLAYVWRSSYEYSNATNFGTTSGGSYSRQYADYDPNRATFGASAEEIEDTLKIDLGFRKDFFKGLETRINLHGEHHTGRPTSFVMNAGSNRNNVFGVNRGGQLAYVPDFAGWNGVSALTAVAGGVTLPNDTKVVIESQAAAAQLLYLVDRFGLEQGRISKEGEYRNKEVTRVDLQMSQELPVPFSPLKNDRFLLTFDVQNVLNLLDKDWGLIEEISNEGDYTLYSVACASATGDTAAANSVIDCARYRISSVDPGSQVLRSDDLSRWVIQIGLKYKF